MTFPTAAATITRRKSFGTAAIVVLLLLKPKYLSAKLVGLSSVFSDPPDKLAGCYRQCVMSSSPGAEQLDGQEPPAIRKQKAPPKRGFFWSLQGRGYGGNLGSPRFRSLPGHVTRSASYMSIPSMPPIPPMPWAWPPAFFFSSTSSATIASVVSKSPATEAAFCRAVRLTLVGSSTPISTRSPNCSVWALKPKLPFPSTILFITTEGSAPELATIWRNGSSSARRTILMPAS